MKLSTLYKYRSVWMGIAMLWVVFFHSGLIIPNKLITRIEWVGYGGVDIFLFASGLGAYFSYAKDHDATEFLKRRLKRLAPVYLLFIVIWISYKFWQGEFPVKAAIGNFFAVQGFTGLGYRFNWYNTCLLLVYILTPFFSGIIDRTDKLQKFFLFIVVLLIISISFWDSHDGIIIVTRLPIFVIGMYFAKLSKDDEIRLTGKLVACLAGAMVVGIVLLVLFYVKFSDYLWAYGLHWYPFILITPGLCIFTSAFVEIVGKIRFARVFFDILKKIGEYSFEVYLVHILCLDIYNNTLVPSEILPRSNWMILLVLLSVIPLCILLRVCSKVFGKLAELFGKVLI